MRRRREIKRVAGIHSKPVKSLILRGGECSKGALREKTLCMLLLILGSAAVLYAQDYEIRLNRPSKIGDKYRLSARTCSKLNGASPSFREILSYVQRQSVLSTINRDRFEELLAEIRQLALADAADAEERTGRAWSDAGHFSKSCIVE
jgi:hypothetical protein